MDEPFVQQMLMWIVVVGLLGFIGIAVVLALLAAWRNYNNRQRLLDEGKRMRQDYSGRDPSHASADADPDAIAPDAWTEAGRRYHEDERRAFAADDDQTALLDASDVDQTAFLDPDDASERGYFDPDDSGQDSDQDADQDDSERDDENESGDDSEDHDDDERGPRQR